MKTALTLLTLCLLCSCVGYRKTGDTETLVGVGMDASEVKLASGATITGLNTSAALKDGSQAIRDITRLQLNAGLIGKGIAAAKNLGNNAIK